MESVWKGPFTSELEEEGPVKLVWAYEVYEDGTVRSSLKGVDTEIEITQERLDQWEAYVQQLAEEKEAENGRF